MRHAERSFEGRVVVVTGASAGVGRAAARLFARSGARVGLIARDSDALDETRAEIESIGGTARCLPADVADGEAVLARAEECERMLGPIDVWVNNAMATVFSPAADMSLEEFRRVTEVTYLGCVHGTLAALRHMRPRNEGVIVQVGSSLAYRGIPLQAAYCGAKHAMRGFTDSVRVELLHARSGITLTTVHLPAVNTPQFDWARTHEPGQPRPMGPVHQAQVAAQAILHAARHGQREWWLGRQTPLVILANMLVPGLVDRFLAARAFEGQTTGRPVRPDRTDNLFRPVRDLHRTDGSFAAEALPRAPVVSGALTRVSAIAGVCLCAGLLGARLGARFGRARPGR